MSLMSVSPSGTLPFSIRKRLDALRPISSAASLRLYFLMNRQFVINSATRMFSPGIRAPLCTRHTTICHSRCRYACRTSGHRTPRISALRTSRKYPFLSRRTGLQLRRFPFALQILHEQKPHQTCQRPLLSLGLFFGLLEKHLVKFKRIC